MVSENERERVLALRAEGKTWEEIAKTLRVSAMTVWRRYHDDEVDVWEKRRDAVETMRGEGLTWNDIAEEFGVPVGRVYRRFRKR